MKSGKSSKGKSNTPKSKNRSNTPNRDEDILMEEQKSTSPERAHVESKVRAQVESYRFAHYQPQAIECMALSCDRRLLAISRENCSIEIWLRTSWVQLLVIPGNKNCAIRNINWLEKKAAQDEEVVPDDNPLFYNGEPRRLITTGLNGVVIEWDMLTKGIKAKHAVQTPIWHSELRGKMLYLACEDGSIKLVKVKKERIELHKSLIRVESKCLSLAISKDERFVFGGYEDSSIRKWEVETGNCVLHFVKQTKKSLQ